RVGDAVGAVAVDRELVEQPRVVDGAGARRLDLHGLAVDDARRRLAGRGRSGGATGRYGDERRDAGDGNGRRTEEGVSLVHGKSHASERAVVAVVTSSR